MNTAINLALLRCLSGGAAGAVSRITGTLGKGIAALTMDDKYQQERRQAMGKKPVNVKEGLTRGGKGLFEVRFLRLNIVSFEAVPVYTYFKKGCFSDARFIDRSASCFLSL